MKKKMTLALVLSALVFSFGFALPPEALAHGKKVSKYYKSYYKPHKKSYRQKHNRHRQPKHHQHHRHCQHSHYYNSYYYGYDYFWNPYFSVKFPIPGGYIKWGHRY